MDTSKARTRADTPPASASASASQGSSTTTYLTGSSSSDLLINNNFSNNFNNLSLIHSLPLIRLFAGVQLLELVGLKYRPEKRDLSGKRGAIEDFSKKSRFRFMRLMATIDGEAAGLPDFVALTYPDEWSRD